MKEIVVSGVRPTGFLHLGNYLGALKNFVQMQETHECYFFIADLHLLTTHPNPADLHQNVKNVIIEYLAAGLDPEKMTLYRQSDLPQISELYLFLNMHAYKGELERVATFKEKVKKHPDNVNAGLLTYPTLMAADILIHKGTKVPVGKDQEQHLEMTRVFGRRFNTIYKTEVFPEPVAFNFGNKLVKVPGLNGAGKMSKSDDESSAIYLKDTPKEIEKKIKRATTDTGPTEPNQPKSEGVANIFTLMEHVSKPETIAHFEEQYNNMTIRYGDLKKQLAEDMTNYLAPIRERIEALKNDDAYIRKVISEGTEKAHISAQKVIDEVREVVGFRKF
ncbi:MAG: tryptophan--tRNA ligase [Sphingobacteriales bacterium]|nr:MAG: tryptophan--tRNA ligase [Sphingobacteriales bacterium]